MNKLYATLILLLACSKIYAQPEYTLVNYAKADSNYLISVGSEADITITNFVQTGEDYIWDYSDLEITTQKEYMFKTRDNSGYFESFMATCILGGGTIFTCPGVWNNLSSLVKSQNEGAFLVQAEIENYSEFQKTSSQKVDATMLGVTMKMGETSYPVTIKYTAPDVLLKFPMVISNKDSSESGFNSDFGSLGFDIIVKRWQKRVNEVDGWGSLVTPYASFAQTLRMLTRIERIDTLFYEGDTVAMPTTEVLAQWWSPDFGQPVFVATGNQTEQGITFTSVSFIDTLRCLEPRMLFSSYPIQPIVDATEHFVDVTFVNLSQNCTHFEWDFGDPLSSENSSTLKNPTHRYTSGGNYEVTLTARNEVCEVPLVAELALPLFVADTADVTASFTFTPSNPLPNEEVYFTSETQNAYNFLWDFGDGATSAEINPVHTYSEVGEYTVSLTASNTTKSANVSNTIEVLLTNADINTASKSISISPNPTSGKVLIGLPQNVTGKGLIEIHSILGVKVHSQQINFNSTNQIELNLAHLPNGLYAVTFKANGTIYNGVIVKR
jgi:PKD repeat protein